MKCLCGHIQPEPYSEEIPVYFQSGKRKGELKHVEERWTYPEDKDLFILIGVEKGFSFTTQEISYGTKYETYVQLCACPKCGTVKLVLGAGQ